jgi:hypothetical protein
MSPEKTPSTAPTPDKPAMIEMPDWNKQKSEQVETAESLIGDAENLDLDAQGRLELMTGFIESIEALARSGDIKNGSGESYSLDKVREQLSELVQELNNPTEGFNPTLLIPRSNGLRSTIDSLLTNESTASALIDAINARGMEVAGKLKTVESLGDKALDVVGIADPAEKVADPLTELTRNLDFSDIQVLRSYAEALQSKRDAQKSGNGENSTYWGQIAGQTWREMKPQIQAISGRYESLYRRS